MKFLPSFKFWMRKKEKMFSSLDVPSLWKEHKVFVMLSVEKTLTTLFKGRLLFLKACLTLVVVFLNAPLSLCLKGLEAFFEVSLKEAIFEVF